ncbi:hypothetical protein M422DRAFT_241125 [Sphaerobolus stellatus SS14]|nr:hypothetical protein M422DRAFT_241125 [Sphaerobolus stellatus SS14]
MVSSKGKVAIGTNDNGTPVKVSKRRKVVSGPKLAPAKSSRKKKDKLKEAEKPLPGCVWRRGRWVPLTSDAHSVSANTDNAEAGSTMSEKISAFPDLTFDDDDDDDDDVSMSQNIDNGEVADNIPVTPCATSLSTALVGLNPFRSFWKQCQPLAHRKRRHTTWPQW